LFIEIDGNWENFDIGAVAENTENVGSEELKYTSEYPEILTNLI
jgi:hypothetical protein